MNKKFIGYLAAVIFGYIGGVTTSALLHVGAGTTAFCFLVIAVAFSFVGFFVSLFVTTR